MSPEEAFGVFLILIGCAAPIIIIGVVYYLKKRLEHKQILTAIEKGTPLSELRPPKQNGALWIKNLTIGIALVVIGLGLLLSRVGRGAHFGSTVALILLGIGIAWIVRGVLNRKYQPRSLPSANSDTVADVALAGASAPEAPPLADEESGLTD
jgi:hypothetical protein